MEDNSSLQEENIGEDNGPVNPLFGVKSEEEAGGGFTGRTISQPSRFKKFEPQVDYNNEEIRAELQSGWELTKGFANQAVVGEVLGGSIEGVGNLLDMGDYITSSMDVEDDLGTYIKEAGQSLRTWSEESTPIHRTEDSRKGWSRFSDPTYWASMGPSIASTLSLMIPAAGAARGGMAAVNKLGQLSKLGRISGKARQLTEGIGMAFASRHMENAMEASQVYKEEYQALKNQGLSEAKARDTAGRGAAHTYRLGYMNLATDIPQYLALLKGADKINSSLREAMENLTAGQAVRQSASELSEEVTRTGAGEIAKRAGQQALSEAGEEAAQYVYQEEGRRVSEEASDLRRTQDASTFSERVKQYTEDPEFWDSALFGSLGGVVFDSVGRVIRDKIDSSRAEQQKKDLQRVVSRLQGVRGHLEDVSKAAAAGSQEDVAASLEKLGERMAVDAASRDVAEREQEMFENIAEMSDEELQQSGFEDPQSARENAQWMAEKISTVRDEYEQNMATSAAVVAQDADRRGEDIDQGQLQDRASIFNTRITELKTAIDRLKDQRREYELRANETENEQERQRLETASENIEREINTREEELTRLTQDPEARDEFFESIQQEQERQENLQNEVEDSRESSSNRDEVSQTPREEETEETQQDPEPKEDEDALRVLEGDLDINEIDPSAGREEPTGPPPEVLNEIDREERAKEQPDMEEGPPSVPDPQEGVPEEERVPDEEGVSEEEVPDPEERDELPFDDTEEEQEDVSERAEEVLTAQDENINPAKHDDTLSKGPEEGDENANLEDTENATEPSEQPSATEQAEEPDDQASVPVPESEEDIDAPPFPEREQEYVDDTSDSRDDDFEIPDYEREESTSPAPRTFFATTMSGYHQLRSDDPIDRSSAQFFEDNNIESLEDLDSIELEAAPYNDDYVEDIDPGVEDSIRGTRDKISDLLDAIEDNSIIEYEVDSDSQTVKFRIGGDTPFVTSITLTFEEVGEVPLRGYLLNEGNERIQYKGNPVRIQFRRIKKILDDSRYDINEGDPEVESYARTRAEMIASMGNENVTQTRVSSESTQMTGVLNYESDEDVRNRLSEVFEEAPTVGYAESSSKVVTSEGDEITGLNVTPGAIYAIVTRPDGRTQFPIRLKSRKVTEREAEAVYEAYRQLIDEGKTETDTFDPSNLQLSSEDEFNNATIDDVLESLVFKGKASENFQREGTTLFRDQGRVRLGDKTFTPDNIGRRKAEFINYLLGNKNAHVNKDIIRQDQPIREFTVLGRSTSSGLSFYTEGDNPAIATDVRTGEDAPYQRLFKNPTIRFGETVQSDNRSSKPIAHETEEGPPTPSERNEEKFEGEEQLEEADKSSFEQFARDLGLSEIFLPIFRLADKLTDPINGELTLEIGDPESLVVEGGRAAAIFNRSDFNITIDRAVLERGGKEGLQETVVHEIIHALIWSRATRGKVNEDVLDQFREIASEVSDYLLNKDTLTEEEQHTLRVMTSVDQGLENWEEVVTYALTDFNVAKVLASIPAEPSVSEESNTLWNRFKDLILSTLEGFDEIQGPSMLDKVADILDKGIEIEESENIAEFTESQQEEESGDPKDRFSADNASDTDTFVDTSKTQETEVTETQEEGTTQVQESIQSALSDWINNNPDSTLDRLSLFQSHLEDYFNNPSVERVFRERNAAGIVFDQDATDRVEYWKVRANGEEFIIPQPESDGFKEREVTSNGESLNFGEGTPTPVRWNAGNPGRQDEGDAKLFSAQGFPESFDRINAASEAEWIRDRLPEDINVETVEGLLDFKNSRGTEAFGAFTDGMEVLLSEDAPRGTGYHEAFHAVLNGVLGPQERRQVIEDAREQYTDNPSDAEIEERLAEQFRRYIQSEGDERLLFGEESTDGFFQRIWKWMKELVGLDTLTVNKLFKEIDQGTYSDRQVLDRQSREFRTRMKEVPGFNPKEVREVLSSLAYYTAILDADILGEGEITDIDVSPSNLQEHLQSRGNFFLKQYQDTSDESRQEMYDTIMGRIAKVMDNIEEFSRLLEEYYQEKFEIDPTIESAGADQTQELGDIEAHVSQPYEHSGKDTATATMRLFIGLQPEIQGKTENGEWIFDTSGYLASPRFNEFGRTWNKIERSLSNIRRYKKRDGTPVNEEKQFIRALKEKSKKVGDNYKDPTIRYIAEKFEQMNAAKRTQFIQAFRKADQGFFVGLWDRVTEDGERQLTFDIGSGNVDRESRVILDEWNFQFSEDLSLDRARTILNAYSQGERNLRDFVNNLQWPRDRDTTKIESAKDTLYRFITGPMNLEISEDGLQNVIDASGDNPVQGIQNVVEGLQWLIDPDNSRAKNNSSNIWRVINNEEFGIERISGGDFLNQSVMRRLARGEAKANEGVVESTVLGPDNNMYWSYSQFNELFSSVTKIAKKGQLFERLRNKLFTQKSRWLNQIAEKDSVANTFSVKTYLNMRNRSSNSNGEKYHNLRPADKLIFDINSILKELGGGRSLFPSLNMSDKSTKHFIVGPEIIRNTVNFEEGLGDIELNDAVIEKLTDYLFEEFKRMRIAENEFRRAQNPDDSLGIEDLTQYYHYKEQDGEIVRGKAFELTDLFENLSYENLEGTQLGDALYNSNGLPKEVHSITDLENGADQLRSLITARIVGEIESTIEEMRDARLIADDSLSYNRESGDPNKFLNTNIENWYSDNIASNENEIILNAISDFTINQLVADIEQQYIFHGDIKMYKTRQDVRKRNPMIAAYGSHLNMARDEVSDRYNVMLMDDVVTESPYFRQWITDYLENTIRDNNPDAEITDDVMDSLESAVETELNEETADLGEEMISLSEDIQIDPADIRDVINTLGPYRAVEETDAQGYITPERFREIMIGLGRWNSQKQDAYETLTDENADREEAIRKSRQADLKFYALKGVHGGLNHQRYDDRSVPTYLKYSQATLFPALTQGTELDGLRKFMEGNDIQEAVYNTGVKVGGKNPQQAFDENGRFVGADSLNSNVMSLSNDQWKLQVETQPHGYEEVLIGSQPKKNIFSNLDPERTYEIDGQEMSGDEAQRFVNRLLSSMVEMDKMSLFGELGVQMDDNGRLRINNFESLIDTVKQQLNRRGAANSIKESISLDANGFPEAPFSASPSKNLIENILFSIIRDRIVQNKVKGGAMVQMSGTGFSNNRVIDWTEIDREDRNNTEVIIDEGKLVPPHKDENGNLVPGSVFLPSYFKDAIPQADQLSQEEMKEYFSNNPELLEGLMYRIPNQAKSSIDIVQVAGFLPEEVGDVVVPYNEITAKTGSDFDIDKLWFMLPRFNVNEEGNPELVEFKDNFENSTEAYNDWVFDRAADTIKRDVSEEMYSEAQSVENRIDEIKANWSERATQRDIENDLFDKAKLMDNVSPLTQEYFTNILRDVASTYNELDISQGHPDRIATMLGRIDEQIELERRNSKKTSKEIIRGLENLRSTVEEAHRRSRNIEEQTEEVAEEEFENLTDRAEELWDSMRSRVASAVASRQNLPTIDEWMELPIEQRNIRPALENKMLKTFREILSADDIYEESIYPLDAANQRLKSIAERVRTEESESILEMGGRNQRRQNNVFTSGKQMVGIVANHIVHHPLAQTGGISIDITEKKPGRGNTLGTEEDDGGVISLDKIRDENGDRITITLSAILNGSVDVAKDPWIFDLNMNLFTANPALTLIRTGRSPEFTFNFINQPIINEFQSVTETYEAESINRVPVEDGPGYKSPEDIIKENYEEPSDAEKERIRSRLDDIEFLREQRNNPTDAAQWVILDEFQFIQGVARDLGDSIQLARVEPQGAGKSLADRLSAEMLRDSVMSDDNVTFNNDVMMLETFIGDVYDNTVDIANDLVRDVMIEATPAFELAVAQMINESGIRARDSETISNVMKELYSYVLADSPISLSNEEIQQHFFSDNSMAHKLADLKRDDDIEDNMLIEYLTYEISDGENNPSFIKGRSSNINSVEKDLITDDWKNLLESDNERLRTFAENLVSYAYHTSGMRKGVFTFHDFIPPSYLKSSGINEHLNEKISEFSDPTALSDAIASVYKHNYDDNTLVPNIPSADVAQVVDRTNGIPTRIKVTKQETIELEGGETRETTKNLLEPYLSSNKTNPPYITFRYTRTNSRGQVVGSQTILMQRETGGEYYKRVQKLGYRESGRKIYEHSTDNDLSSIPTNDPGRYAVSVSPFSVDRTAPNTGSPNTQGDNSAKPVSDGPTVEYESVEEAEEDIQTEDEGFNPPEVTELFGDRYAEETEEQQEQTEETETEEETVQDDDSKISDIMEGQERTDQMREDGRFPASSSSRARAKNYLISQGVIDRYLNVKDYQQAVEIIGPLNRRYREQYNLPENLFHFIKGGKEITLNRKMFNLIDTQRGLNRSEPSVLESNISYLFDEEQIRQVSDVISDIQEQSDSDLMSELASMLEEYVPINNVEIEFITDPEIIQSEFVEGDVEYAGFYYSGSGRITINTQAAEESKVLHEIIHAFTQEEVEAGGSSVAQLREFYEEIIEDDKFQNMYATQDLSEFIAGIFTDPELIRKLKDTQAVGIEESPTLWDRVVELITQLFVDNPSDREITAFEEGMSLTIDVLESSRKRAEAMHMSTQENLNNRIRREIC